MLLNTSSKILFKAAAITQEIESLEAQLQSLLYNENGSAAVDAVKAVSPPAPKAKDKISAGKTTRRKKRLVKGLAQNDREALPEKKVTAAASELGEVTQRNSGKVSTKQPTESINRKAHAARGLAQAIREVLAASAKPLTVSGIYDALIAEGYVFSFSRPKKGLSMRMYRIKGVKPLGEGMFASATG